MCIGESLLIHQLFGRYFSKSTALTSILKETGVKKTLSIQSTKALMDPHLPFQSQTTLQDVTHS